MRCSFFQQHNASRAPRVLDDAQFTKSAPGERHPAEGHSVFQAPEFFGGESPVFARQRDVGNTIGWWKSGLLVKRVLFLFRLTACFNKIVWACGRMGMSADPRAALHRYREGKRAWNLEACNSRAHGCTLSHKPPPEKKTDLFTQRRAALHWGAPTRPVRSNLTESRAPEFKIMSH